MGIGKRQRKDLKKATDILTAMTEAAIAEIERLEAVNGGVPIDEPIDLVLEVKRLRETLYEIETGTTGNARTIAHNALKPPRQKKS